MTWIANHSWIVPLVLNVVLLGLALWLMPPIGEGGPDKAAEMTMLVMIAVFGTLAIWGMFGAYHLFAFLWAITFR